jgi:hypothetical protein
MNDLSRTGAMLLAFMTVGARPAVAQMHHPDHDLPGAHVEVRSADGRVAADVALDLTIDIGDLRLSGARAIVAPPIPGFTSYQEGVIGASLFRNFVVAIDYDTGRITLQDPKRYVPAKDAVSVPLTLEHNMPFAEVTVLGPGGRRIPARVVVDLGVAHQISLNTGTAEGLEPPAGAIRTIIGQGVGGSVRGQVGRIAGVDLGGVIVKDVVATFPDREHQNPAGMKAGNGILGDGLLQRFHVAFDYAHNRMLLSPNKAFDQPFEWDMSGLWLQPEVDDALRVASVVADSAAAQAGLASGEILARVNGKPVAAADLPALRRQLRQAGQVLEVTVMRDGKPIDATLRLRRQV